MFYKLHIKIDGDFILMYNRDYGFKQSLMRIRQMGFSSRLKAHRHLLTLETLKFIVEFLKDGNARGAALRAGIPETYASRQGAWLKKLPIVGHALERELDERDLRKLEQAIHEINKQMDVCKKILGLEEF